MKQFIAYYRVSTKLQQVSGLGLEAQRDSVENYSRLNGKLIGEYTEVESGRATRNRPQLKAALDDCKQKKAVLLIARLDRLSRSVAFISALMESTVEFVAVDNPAATTVMLHIMASFAQYERELISKRTKEAMAAAKAKGKTFGNPDLARARQLAAKARWPELLKPEVRKLILHNHARGMGMQRIAEELNKLGIATAHGHKWYGSSVQAVIRHIGPWPEKAVDQHV